MPLYSRSRCVEGRVEVVDGHASTRSAFRRVQGCCSRPLSPDPTTTPISKMSPKPAVHDEEDDLDDLDGMQIWDYN